jgi:hypothetical protein
MIVGHKILAGAFIFCIKQIVGFTFPKFRLFMIGNRSLVMKKFDRLAILESFSRFRHFLKILELTEP